MFAVNADRLQDGTGSQLGRTGRVPLFSCSGTGCALFVQYYSIIFLYLNKFKKATENEVLKFYNKFIRQA